MSPEFRLLCACCGWPDDQRRAAAVRDAAQRVADWAEVERLAARHRVEPLVANGLEKAGLAVPDAIAKAVAASRLAALRDLAETLRIAALLDDAGIVHRFLKGAPLSIAAYGNLMLKRSLDVDLLVLPEAAVETAGLLAKLGYRAILPPRPLNDVEFKRWSRVSKEAELRSPGGTVVELHWSVSDHPDLLSDLVADSPARRVALLGDRGVATLEDAANLAYLAVHGTAHAWFRLKWIADFRAFSTSFAPSEREAMFADAAKQASGHALATARRLADHLFDGAALGVGRPAALARLSLRALTADEVRVGRIASAVRWRMAPGLRFALAQLQLRLRGTLDRVDYPLPPKWQFLYPILRLPFLFSRKLSGLYEGTRRP